MQLTLVPPSPTGQPLRASQAVPLPFAAPAPSPFPPPIQTPAPAPFPPQPAQGPTPFPAPSPSPSYIPAPPFPAPSASPSPSPVHPPGALKRSETTLFQAQPARLYEQRELYYFRPDQIHRDLPRLAKCAASHDSNRPYDLTTVLLV